MTNPFYQKARAGDKAAEEKLFSHLLARFRLFATRKTGEEYAEDVAMEACRIILGKYREEGLVIDDFDAWSHGVLKNVIRNFFRTKKTADRFTEFENGDRGHGRDTGESVETMRMELLRCLRQLLRVNPRYARALVLSGHGFRASEISEKLHVNTNNLYTIFNRARALLKRCLEE